MTKNTSDRTTKIPLLYIYFDKTDMPKVRLKLKVFGHLGKVRKI